MLFLSADWCGGEVELWDEVKRRPNQNQVDRGLEH